jgi:8-oxo-dGTP pyrophosphatase MutT (NUDIX family)
MSERWKPSVTVAAVIEADGRFLLVEERTPEGLKLNNPAGHLDPGESPVQGAVREALEETARVFTPDRLVGVYLARLQRTAVGGSIGSVAGTAAVEDITYLRFAFGGSAGEADATRTLDEPIERTLWMTLDEVRASTARHRSPLVLQCIEDFAAGKRHPMDVVVTHASVTSVR